MWWRTPWLQQRWMLFGLAVFDGLVLVGSYNLLFWHRFDRWAGMTGSITGLTALWIGTSYLIGRYSRPNPGERDTQVRRLLGSSLVSVIALCVIVVIANWGLRIEDPRTFRSFVLPVIGSTMAGSSLVQAWLVQKQQRVKHWLLIATSKELEVIQQEIKLRPSVERLAIRTLEAKEITRLNSSDINPNEGIAISTTAEISDAATEAILSQRGKGTNVTNILCWCEQNLQRVPPELLSNRWLTTAEGFDLQPGNLTWRVKRMGDIVTAGLILISLAPVIAAAALLIKLEDDGPIFYKQIRSGLYGQAFTVWKLRSMRIDSERNGARWAEKQDSRITRIGGILRRTRLDELPQLLSVLKGDMSLIGPRPERPEIEVSLEQEINHYRIRHWIRPGLSGWAQVCFPYGASISDSRMKLSYDLFYLRNAGLLLDLLILIKTIRLVFRAEGAIPLQSKKMP